MRVSRSHIARKGLVPLIAFCALLPGLVSSSVANAAPPPIVTQISAGLSHTCVVADGGAKCWGRNIVGQLGDGTTSGRAKPVDVLGLTSGVAMVSAGSGHSCAVTTAGGLKCWGRNNYGQLGDGSLANSPIPVDVLGLTSGVAMVSTGAVHTCAVTTAGAVKCWGRNLNGQLGNASVVNSSTPVDVVGLSSGAAQVSAGGTYTCAVTTAGGAECWGDNHFGQLGNADPAYTSTLTPVNVFGLSAGISAISAGNGHTCALRMASGATSPGAKCWGSGAVGQLGNGANSISNAPVSVSTLTVGVNAITAGDSHTCARKTNGGIRCWGYNATGQLGDGGTGNQSKPVAVAGLPSGMSAVAAGGGHTCVITGQGAVKCWGGNAFGQLGDGTRNQSLRPVDVIGLGGVPADPDPPTVTIVLTAPNGGVPDGQHGWFVHGPVTGTVTADDSASGGSNIDKPVCTGATLGTITGGGTPHVTAVISIPGDGVHHISCTATDAAGNTSAAATKDVSLDATAPVVKVKVQPKAIFLHGTATVSFNASDNIGPVTTTCPAADTSAVGKIDVVCSATDQAGNVGTGTGSFVVKYRIVSFASVGGTSFPRGSTIPFTMALADASSTRISDSDAQALATSCAATISFTGGNPPDPCVSTYDAATDRFSYSLPTSAALAAGTYTVTLTIALPAGASEKVTRDITLT
jgi:alpha-tubulin suppressor-like RCC1 family protein